MRWCVAVGLTFMMVHAGWGQSSSEEDYARSADENLLKSNKVPLEGPGLLQFFRDRTLSKEQVAQLSSKVKMLGSNKLSERQQAAVELIKAGNIAKPLLSEAVETSEDLEVVRRAELCLRQLADGGESQLASAAARQVARAMPENAAAVLLAYLPFAVDRRVIEAVQGVLPKLAVRNGRTEKAVLDSLRDSHLLRRGAAGESLVRSKADQHKTLVEPLLKDPAVSVCLQVALALVESGDKAAVGPLIDLLPSLPADQVWQAEDLLARIAGDSAPGLYVGPKTPAAKVQEAWHGWWAKHAKSVDLAKLHEKPALAGYTLISQISSAGAAKGLNGSIIELKPDGEVNWTIDGLRYPLDAQYLGKDRLLVAEYLARRVTERNTKGDILWEKQVDLPIACQRIPGGNTFIATRRSLMIVDREGKSVFTYHHQNTSITAAQRLRDGQMILFTSGGLCQRLDSQGELIKTFQAGQVYTMGGNIDVLPGGRILAPLYRENRVVEYDFDGNQVWQAAVTYPTSVARLPNGNTLVVSMTQQRVIELDRQGKEVWTSPTMGGRPWRARKR